MFAVSLFSGVVLVCQQEVMLLGLFSIVHVYQVALGSISFFSQECGGVVSALRFSQPINRELGTLPSSHTLPLQTFLIWDVGPFSGKVQVN